MSKILTFFVDHWILTLILIIVIIIAIAILRRNIIRSFGMRRIDRMTGQQFEIYLYEKLRGMRQFKSVRHVGQSGDYGADLILTTRDNRKIIVQAKRYQGYVGIAAVQEVLGAVSFYNADEGWVITNSTYSQAAKALAAKSGVSLYDRTYLYELTRKRSMKDAAEGEPVQGTAELIFTYKRVLVDETGKELNRRALETELDEYLIQKGYRVTKPGGNHANP